MPERPTHWRNYADLTPSEKTRVRKMYTQGDEIMAIARPEVEEELRRVLE